MQLNLPSYLPLAQRNTPLQLLANLSDRLGGPRIWVKRDDLTGSVLSGNKIRKLEFLCADALEKGADVLLTCGGVQSNHCRATALIASQMGLKCHLILREEPTGEFNGNLLLDHIANAEISIYPKKGFSNQLNQYFSHWQKHYVDIGLKPYSIPTGGSNGLGVCGYLQCVSELEEDFEANNIHPEYIFCASGSGGTQAGLTLGFAHSDYKSQVVGVAVCDSEKYFFDKVSADINQWQALFEQDINKSALNISTVDDYIGAGYGLASEDVFNTISLVAREEGIVLDPVYTGKAFMGMLKELKARQLPVDSDVVFVHTGGVFGLFPYHQQIQKFLQKNKAE